MGFKFMIHRYRNALFDFFKQLTLKLQVNLCESFSLKLFYDED